MIAYCGLSCNACPIHLATIEESRGKQKTMRIAIAEECSKLYGKELKPEEVGDCDGCRVNTGRLFSWCSECEVRKCAMSNTVETCAHCPDYACEKLRKFFGADPTAEKRLEEIRKTMN